MFFFYRYGDHRDLHVLTHSFPTRRSSDLIDTMPRAMAAPSPRVLFSFTCAAKISAGSISAGGMCAAQGRARASAALSRKRSEEHTSELQSLMRISYAVFCLKKKTKHKK